jgi:hypothetical protein
LNGALDETTLILEPIWQDFCTSITRADFWVLAATFALWGADPTGTLEDIIPINFGRVDNCNCDPGEFIRDPITGVLTTEGRMPVLISCCFSPYPLLVYVLCSLLRSSFLA